MERRTILATAGAITATVLAGTAAVGANVGLLDSAGNDKVGQLSPVVNTDTATTTTAPPEIETVIVDEPVSAAVSAPGSGAPGSTAPVAGDSATSAPVAAPAPTRVPSSPGGGATSGGVYRDDDSDDGPEDEHGEEHEDEHEDEREGSEDDD